MYQKQPADDSAEVVDQRSYGLHAELLADQKHRAKDSAAKEEQLRGQHNARQACA